MRNHPRRRSGGSCSDSNDPAAASLSDGFSEAEVALGRQIRECYIRERTAFESQRKGVVVQWTCPRHWDGKPARLLDGVPAEGCKAVTPTWPKIARRLIEAGIEVYPYVRWAFETKMLRTAPEPNHLHGAAFIDGYLSQVDPAEQRTQCQLNFESERQRAATEIAWNKAVGSSERDAYLMTATHQANGLSPLFRYCLAVLAKHDGLAEKLFHSATVQYGRARNDYDMVWGQHLPADFRERAAQYYSEVVLQEVTEDAEARPD